MHLNWGHGTIAVKDSRNLRQNKSEITGRESATAKKWKKVSYFGYFFPEPGLNYPVLSGFYRFYHGTERDGRHVDRMYPGQRLWRHLGLPGRSLQNYENRIKRRKSSQLKRFWWLFWRFIQGKVTPYRHYIVHIWIMLMIKSFARRLASRHWVRKYSRALA